MNDYAAAPTTEDLGHVGVTVTTLTPRFKLIFLTVLGLTVVALVMNAILAISLHQLNDQQKSLLETCSTITKTGFGAMVGLISGKAI